MLKPFLAVLTLCLLMASSHGGTEVNPPSGDAVPPSLFDKGRHEMQLGLGYNFSTASNAPLRPRVADLNAALRYGWMLNSPGGTGFLRGNCEFIVEAVAGGATDGPGGVIIGGTLIFRYNFIQPSSRWIPYVQAGIGAVYNDIYRQHPQRVIGQSVEFTVQGEIGLRYQLNPHTALYAEAGYRHISNAGLADRNYGLNSLAVQVGMSWLW